jgi:hypothetical protein
MNRISNHGGNRLKSKMTEEAPVSRFLVRRGAWGGWMVWDRHMKGPAKHQGKTAVDLSEEQARKIADELTKQYIAKG